MIWAAEGPAWYANDREILRRSQEFQRILFHVREDRGMERQKMLKSAVETVDYFIRRMRPRFRSENRVLFPYLREHIPKLDAAVTFLHLEQTDFDRRLNALRKHLKKLALLKKEGAAARDAAGRIHDEGLYIIYALRHYLVAEKQLFENFRKVLNRSEVEELGKLLRFYAV